jgi:pSer/pThr/pTyr-binding forkhead associated (FHA) protein
MMVGSLQGASLAAFIPVWRMTELATGIALGMVMAFVDQVSRLGALRLELGRNEFKEWNLDEIVNRIGAAEGVEVPVRGFQGVAPVHAQMTWRPSGFVLDGGGGPVLLNGSPVQSAALSHMDRITVGTATLVFLAHSSLFAVRTTRPSHEPARVPTPVGQPIALGTVPVAMLIDAAGGKYSLPEGRHGVGRDASNPICLGSEASVSRHHAEIVVGPQGIEVVDLGSTNGTRINGRRLTGAATVGRGDCLEFGTVRFTLS